jgi:hypothetical protein
MMLTDIPVGPEGGDSRVIVGADGVTVKLLAEVPVPDGVVTEMGPVVALFGTVVVICVELTTLKGAPAGPLKVTAVVPVKFVPVMVTLVFAGPLVGVKPVMVGALTAKLPAEVAVPPGVVTEMGPVVALFGTVVVICVALSTANGGSPDDPWNATDLTQMKFVPVIVTLVPGMPLVGVKLVMVGAGGVLTVKLPVEVPVPDGVVTEIVPLVPQGTVAVICVELFTLKVVAGRPWNVREVAPVKFVPVMVTLVPAGPLVGVKLVIVGAGGACPTAIVVEPQIEPAHALTVVEPTPTA